MSKTDINKADVFEELVNYRQKYKGEIIVIKAGGELADDDAVLKSLCRQLAFLSSSIHAHIVVVHGGGDQITRALEKEGLEEQKDPETGLRITTKKVLEVSDAALAQVNSKFVRAFMEESQKVTPLGLAGYNGKLVLASTLDQFTGEAKGVNSDFITGLFNQFSNNIVPIIYPICLNNETSNEEKRLNVNADNVASAIATALNARRLIICSNVSGVLDKNGHLIPEIYTNQVNDLIEDGTITGGMIDKVKSAARAANNLKQGGVVILHGRESNSILAELLTVEGQGTLFRSPEFKPPKSSL